MARMYLRKIKERDYPPHGSKQHAGPSQTHGTPALFCAPTQSPPDALEKMELGEIDGPVDVTAKFPEMDFPKGASAMYQPRMEKLFVRNTAENLTILEEILDAMDVAKMSEDVEQVEIEAKFIEVAEGTLEELGFRVEHAQQR